MNFIHVRSYQKTSHENRPLLEISIDTHTFAGFYRCLLGGTITLDYKQRKVSQYLTALTATVQTTVKVLKQPTCLLQRMS